MKFRTLSKLKAFVVYLEASISKLTPNAYLGLVQEMDCVLDRQRRNYRVQDGAAIVSDYPELDPVYNYNDHITDSSLITFFYMKRYILQKVITVLNYHKSDIRFYRSEVTDESSEDVLVLLAALITEVNASLTEVIIDMHRLATRYTPENHTKILKVLVYELNREGISNQTQDTIDTFYCDCKGLRYTTEITLYHYQDGSGLTYKNLNVVLTTLIDPQGKENTFITSLLSSEIIGTYSPGIPTCEKDVVNALNHKILSGY